MRVPMRLRFAVLGLACWAATVAAPVQAVPVYTVAVGAGEMGAAQFLEDLGQIWKGLHVPAEGRLAVIVSATPEARLRLLTRGRGHFAIIDTAAATSLLVQHEGLAAIALLWPGYLHVVAGRQGAPALQLPMREKLAIAESARYVFDALMEWNQDTEHAPTRAALIPDGSELLNRSRDDEEVVLFSAPAPFAPLAELLEQEPALRLLPVSPRLMDELRLLNPWLQTETLAAGTYPGMSSKLLLPVRHVLLVGRKDLPEAIVAKMLISLYTKARSAAPYSPLFGALNRKLNVFFAQLFPYHPVTAKRLRFPKKSP
jgi:TRAP-type uncharacterized transport system substrate-binding protein